LTPLKGRCKLGAHVIRRHFRRIDSLRMRFVMITVLIVDDNVDFRRRVRSFVSADAGIQVIGEAPSMKRKDFIRMSC
jgi:hypothetical protein